ncbi:hypothetical protein JW960_01395 [candidate division KSB1 bacterium]|nr:hypothetical protein [candidate division KSB1 bacterium]
MKKHLGLIVSIIALSAMSLFAAKPTNFSGTWMLDESKLEANDDGRPRMEAKKIEITQDKKIIMINRFLSNPMMGDFTVADSLTLDGKECSSETQFGLRKSTVNWSDDKKELTIKTTILMNWDGQENEMKATEILGLDKKGDVLKIVATRVSPMGEMNNTIYYNKSK